MIYGQSEFRKLKKAGVVEFFRVKKWFISISG